MAAVVHVPTSHSNSKKQSQSWMSFPLHLTGLSQVTSPCEIGMGNEDHDCFISACISQVQAHLNSHFSFEAFPSHLWQGCLMSSHHSTDTFTEHLAVPGMGDTVVKQKQILYYLTLSLFPLQLSLFVAKLCLIFGNS